MTASKEKVEATERPWHRAGNEQVAYIVDNDRELIFELIGAGDSYTEEDIAKLELTLRAVNNHDALVDLAYKGFALAAWVANTKEKNNKEWLEGLHELNKAFVEAYKATIGNIKSE